MSLLDLLGGSRAQMPGQSQGGVMQRLLAPEVALPMAAALMGNQGNMQNLGNAFAQGGQAMAQTRDQNRTYQWLQQNAPEFAQLMDGGLDGQTALELFAKQRFAQTAGGDRYKSVGGHIFDTEDKAFLSPPSGGSDFRMLSPEEETTFGLDPNRAYQMGGDGKIAQIGGGGVEVNLNDGMKLTEAQSKDIGFFTRGLYANDELAAFENELTSLPGFVAGQFGVPGNYYKAPQYRQAERAGREVLAVILRKDTGAAVTPAEFELYGPMYLPWPGDDAATVAAKRKARERAIEAMELGLGTATPLAKGVRSKFGASRASQPRNSPVPAVEDMTDAELESIINGE